MTDPDFEDLLPLLSVPAAAHDPGPAGVSRRRFLQGVLASTGALGLSGTRWARDAFASPIGPTDGVLVMVMLGGGVDGLFRLRADGTVERGLALYTIRNGQFEVLDPAPERFDRGFALDVEPGES